MSELEQSSAYDRLIAMLDAHGAKYKILDHPPKARPILLARFGDTRSLMLPSAWW